MFSMYHKGQKVEFNSAGELGEKAAHIGLSNPYEPMTFEYDYFANAKRHEIEKLSQQSKENKNG